MNEVLIYLGIPIAAGVVLWYLVFPLLGFALEELDLYLSRRK